MVDPDDFTITLLQAQRGSAVKKRTLVRGKTVKSDPTLNETFWRIRQCSCPADADRIVRLLHRLALRRDLAAVHGAPAPGLDPNRWHRRLSAESHGSDCTLIAVPRNYIPLDFDDGPLPADSPLIRGEHLPALAEHAREIWLPPALRDVDLAIGASSSSSFKASLHAYALLDRAVPLSVIHDYLAGAQAAGFPIDPRPALPGQLFLTGRPVFWGLDDPVPPHLYAFVLPGRRQCVSSIDWHEFDAPLAVFKESERCARVAGAELGWRAVLDRYLGDGEGRLGFFKPFSISLGCAARSSEPVEEIAGAMHAIVTGHPDLHNKPDRVGQYTPQRFRNELKRLRGKDARRDTQIAGILQRLLPGGQG